MLDPLLQQEDSVKKGKILFMVLFITFSYLFHKLLGPLHEVFLSSLILASIYAFISFWGFLWSLSFQVNAKIMLVIAPQLALIVFSQVLFFEMLFLQTFGRLYETILMILLLLFLFSLTYFNFLTSNVFAVSSFKRIPLEAVAKTTIYLLSAISVFFATYGFLALEMYIPLAMIFLFAFFALNIFFLLSHFYLEMSSILLNGSLIFWNMLLMVIGGVIYASRVEFVALLATTVFYFTTGFFINKREQITGFKILEYVFILVLIAILANSLSF
jgi:hypothetical protein